MKVEMSEMMKNQTENLKELVQLSVNDTLAKRKEQVLAKKKEGSSDGGSAAVKKEATQFYEKKLKEFETAVDEKRRRIEELETEVTQQRETEIDRDEELDDLKTKLNEQIAKMALKEKMMEE